MTLIQWNINGWKTHFNDLKILIKEENPFCICLQETHLKANDNISLKNFEIYRTDSPNDSHGYRGVMIAVNKSVFSKKIEIVSDLQIIAVTVHLGITFSICNIYLPPNQPIQTEDLLHIYNSLPHPILFLGDLNGHSPMWGSTDLNARGKIIERFIDLSNTLLLNTGEATFLSSTFGTYSSLDLTICSPSLYNNIEWTVLPELYGSDHFPIRIKLHNTNHNITKKPRWIIEKADWPLFTSLAQPPAEHPSELSVEAGCHLITNTILQAAKSAIPKTKGTTKRPSVPWFNDQCKIAIQNRRRSYRKFQKNSTLTNLIEYKKQRSICRRTINNSKNESWKQFVETINASTPTKIVWNKIRKINKDYTTSRYTLLREGKLTDDPEAIAKIFAEYYSELFNPITHSPNSTNNSTTLHHTGNSTKTYNSPFTIWELKSTLRNLKGSSPGPDDIHYSMMQHLPQKCLNWLLSFYNHLWERGEFPNTWRRSEIVPIPKTGKDKRQACNYRPIFLTSCLCKTVERMVNKRLMWYLERQDILQNFQCGYRKGRSTIDHLVKLEAELQYAFVQKQDTIVIFFDMVKAFDRINKNNIIKKLASLEITGNLATFISQFLSQRISKIQIGNTNSEYFEQNIGVPQGCVLSTTLFALAISDLARNLPRGVKAMLYVDDLAIMCRSTDVGIIKRNLQEALNRLKSWSDTSGLTFSTEKTKCIHFSRRRQMLPSPELTLGELPLPYVEYCRFLGLTFDRRLSWNFHIKSLKENCMNKINVLKVLSKTKWGADRSTMLKIYKALICSKLDYGCFVYGSARLHSLTKLDTVHHTGIRIATGAFKTSPILSLCVESGIPPLLFRRHKLAINYISRLYLQPTHPSYNYIFKPKLTRKFLQKPNTTLPLAERISFAITNLKKTTLNIPETYAPPWTYQRPNIYLELSKFRKQNATPSQYQDAFHKLINNLPNHTAIYTDGSKSDGSTGSAFVTPNSTHKKKLHHLCNIYSAELNAIASALYFTMTDIDTDHIAIISDSMSALQGLNDMYSKHPIVRRIHEYLIMLEQIKKTIHFIWAPGHVGIVGNEMADKAAKDALTLPGRGTTILTASELARPLKECVGRRWQAMWDESPSSKLKPIKRDVKPWATSNRGIRREEVAIARLRIGHTRLTHVYLITKEPPPKCQKCNCSLTIKHIFEECYFYKPILNRYTIPSDISLALKDDQSTTDNIIKFIKYCKLINNI